jgi:hypothetical protein
MPVALTVNVWFIDPSDQSYVAKPEPALSVVFPFSQKAVLPVMTGLKEVLSVIVALPDPAHPLTSTTSTEKTPGAETVMVCVVALLLQS